MRNADRLGACDFVRAVHVHVRNTDPAHACNLVACLGPRGQGEVQVRSMERVPGRGPARRNAVELYPVALETVNDIAR